MKNESNQSTFKKVFLSTQAIQELDWDNKGQIAFFEIGFNLSKLKRKIVKKKVISLKVQYSNPNHDRAIGRVLCCPRIIQSGDYRLYIIIYYIL